MNACKENDSVLYLDADWTPLEMEDRKARAADYCKRVFRRRRDQSRMISAIIQRLILGSAAFFLWAVLLALLVGSR